MVPAHDRNVSVLAVAGSALTVQLKFVCDDVEVVLASHFVLEFLDIAILKLDDFSTRRANHVIVVSLVGYVVVVCLGSKMPLLRQSTLAKKIECAVDGRESDMRFAPCEFVVELLGGDMFHLEKGLEDNLTLAGDSQFMIGEMLSENGYLVSYGFFCGATWHGKTSLILIMNLFIIPLAEVRQGTIVENALIYSISGRSWLSATALTLA